MDIIAENHGTIWLFRPQSAEGREWIEEHVADPMWFGHALAVEHRYALPLADGMLGDGLAVMLG